MKKLFKTFSMLLAAAALATATSCSDDLGKEAPGNRPSTPEADGEGVYMALEIKMPDSGISGRSQTNDDGTSTADPGTEIGSNEENKVKSVAIVLAKPDNTFITYGLVYTDRISSKPNTNSYESVAKFSKSDFESYYKPENFSQEVNVFVFCNPTADLIAKLNSISLADKNTTWINEACEVKAGISGQADINTSIWADNSFLMTNASIAPRLLPKAYDDWDNYRKPETAFNLSGMNSQGEPYAVDNETNAGAIKVERVVARFDYKDGSVIGNGVYNVLTSMKTNADGTVTDGPYFINVQLGRMCLVNMSNQFYYLPRVSDDGLGTNAELCGKETSTNYVVGPYYNTFNKAAETLKDNPKGITYTDYFNYPFFNADGKLDGNNNNYERWYTSNTADVLGGTVMDNWKDKQYHVWRYVTENVIPGVQNQKNGISTGIVFKAKMQADATIFTNKDISYPNKDELIRHLNNVDDCLKGDGSDPFLYMFGNRLYITWEDVRAAVQNECVVVTYNSDDNNKPVVTINPNTPLYIAVYGTGGMGDIEVPYKNPDGTLAAEPLKYSDPKAYDTNCADAKWSVWNENGRPLTGTLIDEMRLAVTGRGDFQSSDDSESSITSNISVQGFTIFQSSTDPKMGKGYYCYYFYWNRHNDNLKAGDMGAMEFAVVRNNVYKLCVTLIGRLGHPMNSDNDPEPPTPDTDDEIDDIYLKVTCDVLPWVVRVNDIEFK